MHGTQTAKVFTTEGQRSSNILSLSFMFVTWKAVGGRGWKVKNICDSLGSEVGKNYQLPIIIALHAFTWTFHGLQVTPELSLLKTLLKPSAQQVGISTSFVDTLFLSVYFTVMKSR